MTEDQFSKSEKQIKPLIKLPVERGIYCSQEMTDYIINILYEEYYDVFEEFVEDESETTRNIVNNGGYFYIQYHVENLVPESMPETSLGVVDLAYELSRRYRKTYNLPDLEPKFPPLAPSFDGVYPPLKRLDVKDGFVNMLDGNFLIYEESLKARYGGNFLTQDIQDIVDDLYKNPEFQKECYAIVEGMRKHMNIEEGKKIWEIITHKIEQDYSHLPVHSIAKTNQYANYVNSVCHALRRVLEKTVSNLNFNAESASND